MKEIQLHGSNVIVKFSRFSAVLITVIMEQQLLTTRVEEVSYCGILVSACFFTDKKDKLSLERSRIQSNEGPGV